MSASPSVVSARLVTCVVAGEIKAYPGGVSVITPSYSSCPSKTEVEFWIVSPCVNRFHSFRVLYSIQRWVVSAGNLEQKLLSSISH